MLELTDGTQRALLTGDAEAEQEAELLKRYGSGLRSTFLKVGHHGSRTSTSPEFLAAVAPTLATVSSGVRNRYGHPHPNTLATLEAGRVSVLRTDQLGGIAWSSAERTTHVASWAGLKTCRGHGIFGHSTRRQHINEALGAGLGVRGTAGAIQGLDRAMLPP